MLARLDEQGARLSRALSQGLIARGQRLRDLARALPRPETLVEQAGQRLDLWAERLPAALGRATGVKRARFNTLAAHIRPRLLGALIEQSGRALAGWSARLSPALERRAGQGRRDLDRLQGRLQPEVLERDLSRKRAEFARLERRLVMASGAQVEGWRQRLDGLERMRATLGYGETLRRGFAVVRGEDQQVLTSRAEAEGHAVLEIEFHDGRLVTGGKGGPAKKAKTPPKPEQGSLF